MFANSKRLVMGGRRLVAIFCVILTTAFCSSVAEGHDLDQENAQSSTVQRQKRQTKPDYHIDVLAFLDYAFYDHWRKEADTQNLTEVEQTAKGYIAYIFEGVNRRYAAITSLPFNLRVTVSHILIAKRPEDSPWTETVKTSVANGRPQVNASVVLEKLREHINISYSTLPKHDHFMLFTRYDLVGEGEYTAGLAYVGTICREDGSSVSVIEDDGGAVSEATAAHELGHSLGAYHDGTNNDCNTEDLYAMTGSGANPNVTEADAHRKLNLWIFSRCSLQYFNETVQTLKSEGFEDKCLLKAVTSSGIPPVPDNLPKHVDQQCRHNYDESSYFCRRAGASPGEVCLKLACYNPALPGDQCTVHTADTGTCCGNRKWCQKGVCSTSSSNKCANVSDICPFDDQPTTIKLVGGNGGTCDQLHSAYCYDAEFRAKCCQRCEKVRKNGHSGCEYGDRVENCAEKYCSFTQYASDCCGTCNNVQTSGCRDTPVRVNVTYGPASDRKTASDFCSEILRRPDTLRLCYDDTFRNSCCKSCEAVWSNETVCGFGDAVYGCSPLLSRRRPCNQAEKESCCHTCKQLDKYTTTTTTTTTTSTTTTTTTTPRKPANTRDTDTGDCGAKCDGCGLVRDVVLLVVTVGVSLCTVVLG